MFRISQALPLCHAVDSSTRDTWIFSISSRLNSETGFSFALRSRQTRPSERRGRHPDRGEDNPIGKGEARYSIRPVVCCRMELLTGKSVVTGGSLAHSLYSRRTHQEVTQDVCECEVADEFVVVMKFRPVKPGNSVEEKTGMTADGGSVGLW